MNGIIKINFSKQTTTQTKLRTHNIKLKATVRYGRDMFALNKRDNEHFEAAQMKFLRPQLGFTKLDNQKITDVSKIVYSKYSERCM
jgi:hypothetical protein